MNQGFNGGIGSATNFQNYVDTTYKTTVLPLLSSTTQGSYRGMMNKYVEPALGKYSLRDLTPLTLQHYFSNMLANRAVMLKVRDTLSSVLRSAQRFGLLVNNPLVGLQLPPHKRRRKTKPFISPEQFNELVGAISEPYATMVYVAVWTGLRISEVIGLKWRCIHSDSITIEERYCRGDWSQPKSEASAATIAVHPSVIQRIHRLKTLTVAVRAGHATRHFKLVKSSGADDLVFR